MLFTTNLTKEIPYWNERTAWTICKKAKVKNNSEINFVTARNPKTPSNFLKAGNSIKKITEELETFLVKNQMLQSNQRLLPNYQTQ